MPVPTQPAPTGSELPATAAGGVINATQVIEQDRHFVKLLPPDAPIQDVNVVPAAHEECQYGGAHVPHANHPMNGNSIARASYITSAEPVQLADMDRLAAPFQAIKPAIPPMNLQTKT